MLTDPISDFLTRVRNAQSAGHKVVEIPASKIKKEIRDIIRGNCLSEYSDLMDYLDAEGIWERIEVAENNTIHFDALLRSIRHKKG